MQPLGLDDGDESITGSFVCGEINRVGHEMGEFSERREGGWLFVDDDVAAMFFEGGRELKIQYQS